MKYIIAMITAMLLFSGCATQDRFQVDHRTGKWYETNNNDCPNVSYNKDESITCYENDKKTIIKTIYPVSEDEVRAYREEQAKKKAQHEAEAEYRRGMQAIQARNFNPNSPRIGF